MNIFSLRIYIYLYVYLYVFIYVRMYVCMYVCKYMCICIVNKMNFHIREVKRFFSF